MTDATAADALAARLEREQALGFVASQHMGTSRAGRQVRVTVSRDSRATDADLLWLAGGTGLGGRVLKRDMMTEHAKIRTVTVLVYTS